jgi:hypothetical protein
MCENCGHTHGPIDVCLLGAVAKVLEDRIERPITAAMLDSIDTDAFWAVSGGEVVDWLEEALGGRAELLKGRAANPTAQEIRDGLRAAAHTRRTGEEMEAGGTDDLAHWLRCASDHPEISMTEAIGLAEVSRPTAYDLVKR